MHGHRRRRATQHTAAIPLCPRGSGGVGPFASLPLLADVPHRLVAAPRIRPHGVPNAAVDISRTGSYPGSTDCDAAAAGNRVNSGPGAFASRSVAPAAPTAPEPFLRIAWAVFSIP